VTIVVDTLARSEQDIDANLASLSRFGRFWLLTVAAVDVLLVISSMVALNAALPDIALQTAATQTQLTWVVDGYTLVLACLLLPAGATGRPIRAAGRTIARPCDLCHRLACPDDIRQPGENHRVACGGGHRRRVHHARDAVVVDRRIPEK
jgi:hypothetical protein